jgi:hypothetical protein
MRFSLIDPAKPEMLEIGSGNGLKRNDFDARFNNAPARLALRDSTIRRATGRHPR